MTRYLPQIVLTLSIWSYWLCVVALMIRSNVQYGSPAGGLPRTRRERLMWIAWFPLILLWQILPPLSLLSSHWLLAMPSLAERPLMQVVQWSASTVAVLAFMLTIPCWRRMGRNWSVAVVPQKKTRLVTEGLFARVRHPIYALSMLMMVSTVLVAPSPAVITMGAVHLTLIYVKTLGEETFLHQRHGPQYADYCSRTGRYLPRPVVRPMPPPPPRKAA